MLQGIDVSAWQGVVDWAAYAEEDIAFGIARASEGEEDVDQCFARNWVELGHNGLVRGASHLLDAEADPVRQARHFLTQVRHGYGDLLAVELPLDAPPEELSAAARRWCFEVTERTGSRPLIHTFAHVALNGGAEGLERYPLWLAAPGRPMGEPVVPAPWHSWTIHQYANSPVNRNVFAGTTADLIALAG
ncbi:glycoside hydrolase family 25 protein [Streptosporangiaceae bacterium NEAU-GS5]|nr:glycoside hydrolase family 25 protein [Streptosporangiaceae bacterium NEAU-GS5]